MNIKFLKYHATGNDFILIDNRNGKIKLLKDQVARLCHRQFGIGADGLIQLFKHPDVDFKMKYYNADGGEGTMCGNGGRCITAFSRKLGIIDTKAKFYAIDGVHFSKILKENSNEFFISLKMSDVDQVVKLDDGFSLNTGSPHFVKFVSNIAEIDVFREGKLLRWDKRFQPEGTNVNFVEIKKGYIRVRSFERGVENITLSCGTGVTASAMIASLIGATTDNQFEVGTDGGVLQVRFTRLQDRFTDVWLEGPAVEVYNGQIEI